MLFFNHIAADDPLAVVYLLSTRLDRRLNNVIFPVSEDYTQLKGGKPEYVLGVQLAEKIAGFKTPRIIQSYRLKDEESDDEQRQRLKGRSEKLAREYSKLITEKIPLGATVVVSPEGHRSPDGRLLPAEKGLGMLVKTIERAKKQKMIPDGLFIPVGLSFTEKYRYGLNLNFRHRPEIVVQIGSPLSLDQVFFGAKNLTAKENLTASDLSHFLMVELAKLLPVPMWGVYHPDRLADTLAGRFELRMNSQIRKADVFDKTLNTFL